MWVMAIIAFLFGIGMVAVLMGLLSLYNGLSSARTGSQAAFSQIEGELTRRHELAGNFAEVARGLMGPDRATVENLVRAVEGASKALNGVLSSPDDPTSMLALYRAERFLESGVERIKAISVAYPEFRASRNVGLLVREMEGLRGRLELLVRSYNESAEQYNRQRRAFPSWLLASFLGLPEIAPFEEPKVEERKPEKEEKTGEDTQAGGRVFYG